MTSEGSHLLTPEREAEILMKALTTEDLLKEIDRLREKYDCLVEAARRVCCWQVSIHANKADRLSINRSLDALRAALPLLEKDTKEEA